MEFSSIGTDTSSSLPCNFIKWCGQGLQPRPWLVESGVFSSGWEKDLCCSGPFQIRLGSPRQIFFPFENYLVLPHDFLKYIAVHWLELTVECLMLTLSLSCSQSNCWSMHPIIFLWHWWDSSLHGAMVTVECVCVAICSFLRLVQISECTEMLKHAFPPPIPVSLTCKTKALMNKNVSVAFQFRTCLSISLTCCSCDLHTKLLNPGSNM